MKQPVKNHAKSVRMRLLNLMNSSGYKYMYLLARYFNVRLRGMYMLYWDSM